MRERGKEEGERWREGSERGKEGRKRWREENFQLVHFIVGKPTVLKLSSRCRFRTHKTAK